MGTLTRETGGREEGREEAGVSAEAEVGQGQAELQTEVQTPPPINKNNLQSRGSFSSFVSLLSFVSTAATRTSDFFDSRINLSSRQKILHTIIDWCEDLPRSLLFSVYNCARDE